MRFKYFLESTISFTTDKGSTYEFNNGKSIRTKSLHAYHLSDDQGLKSQSEITVFIDSETAREVGMWQTLSAYKKRIILLNGRIILVSFNNQRQQHGIDKIQGNSSFVMIPQVGLCPLELFQPDHNNWSWLQTGMQVFAGSHPGNPIITVNFPRRA